MWQCGQCGQCDRSGNVAIWQCGGPDFGGPHFFLSNTFFLDKFGCVAKMSLSALPGFNADRLICKVPKLPFSHSDGIACCAPAGLIAIRLPSFLASRIFEG
jgi:hypothetical protein